MSLEYGLYLPVGFVGELASFEDPIEAYETLTTMAQAADERGYETVWLPDHLLPAPHRRKCSSSAGRWPPLWRAIPRGCASARW